MLNELQHLATSLGPAGYVGSFTTYFDHGLLLIEDLRSVAVHDDWDGSASLVNLRADSLCLRTQVYVDGPVTVFVLRGAPTVAGGHPVFAGEIESPSKVLRVEDSDAAMRLQFHVDQVVTRLSVVVDDTRFVGCVAILVAG